MNSIYNLCFNSENKEIYTRFEKLFLLENLFLQSKTFINNIRNYYIQTNLYELIEFMGLFVLFYFSFFSPYSIIYSAVIIKITNLTIETYYKKDVINNITIHKQWFEVVTLVYFITITKFIFQGFILSHIFGWINLINTYYIFCKNDNKINTITSIINNLFLMNEKTLKIIHKNTELTYLHSFLVNLINKLINKKKLN